MNLNATPSGLDESTITSVKEPLENDDNTELGSDDNYNHYEYVMPSSLPSRITYV